MKAETVDDLRNCKNSFRDNSNYKRFQRFADDEAFGKVEAILNAIEDRAEEVKVQEAAERAAIQAQQEEERDKEQLADDKGPVLIPVPALGDRKTVGGEGTRFPDPLEATL
jgi:hypothetical protein